MSFSPFASNILGISLKMNSLFIVTSQILSTVTSQWCNDIKTGDNLCQLCGSYCADHNNDPHSVIWKSENSFSRWTYFWFLFLIYTIQTLNPQESQNLEHMSLLDPIKFMLISTLNDDIAITYVYHQEQCSVEIVWNTVDEFNIYLKFPGHVLH